MSILSLIYVIYITSYSLPPHFLPFFHIIAMKIIVNLLPFLLVPSYSSYCYASNNSSYGDAFAIILGGKGDFAYFVDRLEAVHERGLDSFDPWHNHEDYLLVLEEFPRELEIFLSGQTQSSEPQFKAAVENGHLLLVKHAVERGIDPSLEDNWAIHQACQKGHLDIVQYLLQEVRVDLDAATSRSLLLSVVGLKSRL